MSKEVKRELFHPALEVFKLKKERKRNWLSFLVFCCEKKECSPSNSFLRHIQWHLLLHRMGRKIKKWCDREEDFFLCDISNNGNWELFLSSFIPSFPVNQRKSYSNPDQKSWCFYRLVNVERVWLWFLVDFSRCLWKGDGIKERHSQLSVENCYKNREGSLKSCGERKKEEREREAIPTFMYSFLDSSSLLLPPSSSNKSIPRW